MQRLRLVVAISILTFPPHALVGSDGEEPARDVRVGKLNIAVRQKQRPVPHGRRSRGYHRFDDLPKLIRQAIESPLAQAPGPKSHGGTVYQPISISGPEAPV